MAKRDLGSIETVVASESGSNDVACRRLLHTVELLNKEEHEKWSTEKELH